MAFLNHPYAKQRVLYIVMALWALLMFYLLTTNVRAGNALTAALVVLLSSPIPLAALGVTVEKRKLRQMFNPKTQSWAFLYGDTFVLTTAAFAAAKGWVHMSRGGWMYSGGWITLSALIGVLSGVVFHALDGRAYRKQHATALLQSPGKLAHDFVAYPVLFGGLFCVGVPLLFISWTFWTWLLVACIIMWLYLGIKDGRRKLNCFNFHVKWDAKEFRLIA